MVELLKNLTNNLGYLILISFLVSKLKSFRKIMQKDKYNFKDLIVLSVFFGVFGIIGTYIGRSYEGAIVNNRIIGVMSGGLLCGPFVGIIAGLIAALHRLLIDIGGTTCIPCAAGTIIAGIFSGYIYNKIVSKKDTWIYGFLSSILIESFEMILILIITKPYSKALNIVKAIYVPMVVTNAAGIAISILLIQNIFDEKEHIKAEQAKIALDIANQTLPYFRELNKNSLEEVCKIIKNYINADAVAITDKYYILAHVGAGEDHHIEGREIVTFATKNVIKNGGVKVLKSKSDINCPIPKCPLKSAVIAPIKDKDKIIGTLKIYYTKENAVTFKDSNLAAGLAEIISTQLEISKVEKLKHMANQAEIKALQAQINPHFLFNVLNTIASFIHIDPEKARELLISVSEYLRYNLESDKYFVDINKEVEHIKCYVNIQKSRFKDKLDVIYDIDDNIDIKIPNLIIEPLVENSIKHGILPNTDNGIIIIKIKSINVNRIIVIVEDNGIGIDENIIETISKNEKIKNKVGLLNVNNRLKQIYGQGLIIERLNKGTRISFYINRLEKMQ